MHDARDNGRARLETLTIPSRRGMLAGSAAALAAGAASFVKPAPLPWRGGPRPPPLVVAGAGDDADLVRLADEIMAMGAESDRLSLIEDEIEGWPARDRFNDQHIRPLVDRHHELMPQLIMMPAATMAGFQAKARVLQYFSNCAPGYARSEQDDALGWSLANDLLGVASVWRPEDDEEDDAAAATIIAAREAEAAAAMAGIRRKTNVETMTRAELEASVPGILEFRDTADRLYRRTIERLGGDVA